MNEDAIKQGQKDAKKNIKSERAENPDISIEPTTDHLEDAQDTAAENHEDEMANQPDTNAPEPEPDTDKKAKGDNS